MSPRTPRSRGLPRLAYALALALISAAALVVEIVAARLLAPYLGMSLYTWTAIIAVVLAGLSVGHWLGGWLDPLVRGRGQAGEGHLGCLLGGDFDRGPRRLRRRPQPEPIIR